MGNSSNSSHLKAILNNCGINKLQAWHSWKVALNSFKTWLREFCFMRYFFAIFYYYKVYRSYLNFRVISFDLEYETTSFLTTMQIWQFIFRSKLCLQHYQWHLITKKGRYKCNFSFPFSYRGWYEWWRLCNKSTDFEVLLVTKDAFESKSCERTLSWWMKLSVVKFIMCHTQIQAT